MAAVRGDGLLMGIELHDVDHPWLSWENLGLPELGVRPSVGLVLCHRLARRGFLCHVAAHDWSVVRLTPALDVADADLTAFIAAFREEVEALCKLA